MPRYVVDQVLSARPHLGRQSSRLDEVLRTGKHVRSVGATAAMRAAEREMYSADEKASNDKFQASLQAEKDLAVAKLRSAAEQEKNEQLAYERSEQIKNQRAQEAAKSQAKANQYAKEDSIAEGEHSEFKAQAFKEQNTIYDSEYDKFFDPTIELLLSPTEAMDYKTRLENINEILSNVANIENLPEFEKVKEEGNIKKNRYKIEEMRRYLPRIERAVKKEKGCAGMSRAPSSTESEAPSQDIEELKRELNLAKARADAADQAAEDCQASLSSKDEEPCPASVLEAAEKYKSLKQEATQKKAAHTIVSVRTVKAKSKLERLEAKLTDAMANAKAEYESYIAYELGGGQSFNPWRQKRQKKLAVANNTVEVLMNEVNAAKAEHDELYVTYIKTFTDQEVATALADAAKARADQLKNTVQVVMGKPV